MKRVKIISLDSVDVNRYKEIEKARQKYISSGNGKLTPIAYNTNEMAMTMHPKKQIVRVKDIIEEGRGIKTFVFIPSVEGSKLAPFRAGQLINVTCKIGESVATRPYSLSSSPKMAREGQYRITVKENGFVSSYLVNQLRVGQSLEISEPYGTFTYQPLRDQKRIIGIAGGIGVTSLYCLAQAILDGDEDVEMTLYYGAKTESDLLFKEKLDDIVCKTNKVKVIYVLSEEQNEKYQHGFISLNLIKQELYDAVSFFITGSNEMVMYLNEEFKSLKLPRKYYRYQIIKKENKAESFTMYQLTVVTKDETVVIPCQSNETLLTALEKAGIKAPSKCYVGTCGFCRSRLLLGKVKMKEDHRKSAEQAYHFIHPCCSYPESNCKIEIFT